MQESLRTIYDRLFAAFGPQGWWEADSPFEVEVGAILTQNTAWSNVERSLQNLPKPLTPQSLLEMSEEALQEAIHPSGYFRQKTRYLKSLAEFCMENGSSEKEFADFSTAELRKLWLSQKGVGKETADSILLYALHRPIFVVDAYTRRVLSKFCADARYLTMDYDDVAKVFTDLLPQDEAYFNEYHALLVALCKEYCFKKEPNCMECPVRDLCKAVDKSGKIE